MHLLCIQNAILLNHRVSSNFLHIYDLSWLYRNKPGCTEYILSWLHCSFLTVGTSYKCLNEPFSRMTRKIVNLTEILVAKGITLALKTYPYNTAFQSSATRHQLTQYVLRRIKSIYIPVESGSPCLLRSQVQRIAPKQQPQIRALIQEGIRCLLPSIAIHYPMLSDRSSLPL